MPSRRLAIAAFVLAMAALLTLSACGDDDDGQDITLDDYFGRVENIFQSADDDTADLQDKFDSDLAASDILDQRVEATQVFLGETVKVFDTVITDMNEITPPDEAETAHEDFVSAAQDARDSADELQGRLAEVETEQDLDGIVSDFETETSETLASLDEACMSLQGIADDNDIAADLKCES